MANIFSRIISDMEGLWKKEEPAIQSALSDVVKAIAPVWKTALGSIVMSTVSNLQGYAAGAGGAAAAELAAKQIAVATKAAGVTAANSTVNTLIELAVQSLSSANTALQGPPPAAS